MKVISESFGFTVETLSPCLPLCQAVNERGEDEEQLHSFLLLQVALNSCGSRNDRREASEKRKNKQRGKQVSACHPVSKISGGKMFIVTA